MRVSEVQKRVASKQKLCSLCFSLHTSLSRLSGGRILFDSNLPRAIEIVVGKRRGGWSEKNSERL